jgi:hypothetical protein
VALVVRLLARSDILAFEIAINIQGRELTAFAIKINMQYLLLVDHAAPATQMSPHC